MTEQKFPLNRRSVLAIGAASAVAGAVGTASAAIGSGSPIGWSRECDVICVGSGAAGLSAAVTATQNGDKVIVLEKLPAPGGTTSKSGGACWLPNNPVLRAAGIVDEEEACLRYIARYSHPERYSASAPRFGLTQLEYERLQAFYRNAAPAAETIISSGAADLIAFTIPGTATLSPDYAPTLKEDATVRGRTLWPRPMADGTIGGAAMIAQITDWLARKQVPLLTEAPVTALVQEGGRVVGVEARINGATARIRARKGVIFASGGFAHNLDLISMHHPSGVDGSCALPGSTGDFIAIAAKVGAQMGGLGTAWRMQAVVEEAAESRFLAQGVFIPPADSMILVNRAGRRAVDEKRNYNDRSRVHQTYDPVAVNYPNRVLFMIFDQRAIDIFGGAYPLPEAVDGAAHVISGANWDALSAAIAKRLPALAPVVGDIELADNFAETLKATVARFNEFARTGQDDDFHRGRDPHEQEWQPFFSPVRKGASWNNPFPAPTMYPLADNGPYHAIILGPGVLDTSGGPLTDAGARVLDGEGKPIPGLFGAGNCIASPTGNAYFGGGGTIGPALTYGHIAANSAHA